MPFAEVVLAAITDAVIGYAVEKSSDKLGEWARGKLGFDPAKKAFKEALAQALERLEEQHPHWVADNFDASFFEHEGAPILAQLLILDGHPDASELATRWADSLNLQNPERRALYTRELEPVAADFLEDLIHELKSKTVLRDLHDSRAFEQMNEALQSLRRKIGADEATFGTRHDYLRWLIERNLYLDPRGVFQTQRQVQVKLDEVYISLKAHYDETPDTIDHLALKKESDDLEAADLAAEEIEDRREHLQTHLEGRQIADELGPALELAEVVTRYDRVVILGDPGSGKTTLLRYLALKHAYALWNGRSEAGADLGIARFPILIRIAEYAEDGTWKKKSLSAFLAESYILHDCPSIGLADLLQTEIEKGHCLLLLDGLDEIVSADERLGVVKQIEDFVRHHISKANRFVITSRKAGYSSAPLTGSFMHYAVQEMDEIQIRRFLERWCQAVENAQTPEISVQERRNVATREIESIMRAVQASLGVRRLAANPLLLRILALIHRTGAQLPQKRIELYRLATDTLARTWRTAQGVSESALVKEEYLTPLLSELAYWLHMNKPTGIATEREVYEVLGKEWARLNDLHWVVDDPIPKITEEVRKFLMAVREHTGLLVERAPRRYGFMHLTFEEYYVARYLVARSKTRAKLIRHHLHQPRWEEPILLSIGFVGLEYPAEASELVEAAILAEGEEAKELGFTSSPYEDLLGRDYLFALRCLCDNIPVRPKLVQRLIERLADERLHRSGSARFQRYEQTLRERLASLGESTGAHLLHRLLIEALHDTEASVRSAAAASLGLLGLASPDAIIGLVATLQDAEVDVCSSAARSLGLLHQSSPEAIAALVIALHHAKSSVRSSAAKSLGLLGQTSPDAIVALIAALQDADANVRSSATASLGLIDRTSPQAISALLTALQDTDANVRSSAAHSLAQLGQPSPEVFSALLAALKDTEASVRSSAAASLGLLGQTTSNVITSLVVTMGDADAGVRLIATQSLGKLAQPSPDAIVALVTALHDVDANVRATAAQYLAQLDHTSPDAIAALVAALQDADAGVRSSAARSLRILNQAMLDAIDALLTAIQDADANVRSSAAHSLGLLGQFSPEVIAALIVALHDAEANVRFYAAQSLGQLGQVSHDGISALVSALRDAQVVVRRATAMSLGLLGQSSPEVIAALVVALHDPEANVRYYAAQSLGQLGQVSHDAISALSAALHDAEANVRLYTAQSLGLSGHTSPEVTAGLREGLRKAQSGSMRRDAARLLGQVGLADAATLYTLWRGLLDDYDDVRTACTLALAQMGRRFPAITQSLEEKFVEAIQDPNFNEPDQVAGRPAYDYAFDGLWFLVVGGEFDRASSSVPKH